MSEPKEIINKLKNNLNDNSYVVAFILVGSQARETVYTATEHSDLEAYIVVKDEATEKVENELPDLVKKLGNIVFSFKHAIGFVAVFDDLFRIELPVIKESEMKSIFNRPKAQVAKILIDKTDGQLAKILDQRPEAIDLARIFEEKVINYWYWQIIGVQYFKKGELYNARVVLGIISSGLVKLFEMLNDTSVLLLESNKRIEQFLNPAQLELLKQVSPGYESEQVKTSLQRMMTIFPETANEVAQRFNYQYSDDIETDIKPKLDQLLKP